MRQWLFSCSFSNSLFTDHPIIQYYNNLSIWNLHCNKPYTKYTVHTLILRIFAVKNNNWMFGHHTHFYECNRWHPKKNCFLLQLYTYTHIHIYVLSSQITNHTRLYVLKVVLTYYIAIFHWSKEFVPKKRKKICIVFVKSSAVLYFSTEMLRHSRHCKLSMFSVEICSTLW
jgi:hypothetical protein